MADQEEIKAIELRRLGELEKQRAYSGVDTDPRILLEISDLRQKYGGEATTVSRTANPLQEHRDPRTMRDLWNEVDFLRALITAALKRMNGDADNRTYHQRVYMAWMLLLTVLLLYALFGR